MSELNGRKEVIVDTDDKWYLSAVGDVILARKCIIDLEKRLKKYEPDFSANVTYNDIIDALFCWHNTDTEEMIDKAWAEYYTKD